MWRFKEKLAGRIGEEMGGESGEKNVYGLESREHGGYYIMQDGDEG